MRLALQVCFVLLVAMFALVGCRGADVVDADHQRAGDGNALQSGNNTVTFHASVRNTIEVVPPFPPPILNAIFEGSGKSRPFGPFEFVGISQVDITVYPADQVTDMVFTYRNGDELHMDSAGTSIEDPPGHTIFSGDFTVVGGTGIFSNATGGGTYAGTAELATGMGQFDMDGVISGFGGSGN